jgi:hypothetical protein
MSRTLILSTDRTMTQQLRKGLRGICPVRVLEHLPEPAELQRLLSVLRPDRILLGTESPSRCRAIAAELKRLAGTEVIAVGRICDPDLLTELAEHGVTRFLGSPFPPELVRTWLQPDAPTVQYLHGDTGRHSWDVDGPVVRS